MMPKKKVAVRILLDRVGQPVEIGNRLEALETEEKKRNPDYKVPDTITPVTTR
jgi:uncharacterized protein YaiL (DUF2058 family)